jgi:superfamily II DNA or RNA helicase
LSVLAGGAILRGLSDLELPADLDTSVDDIDAVLYNPCLRLSATYDRGVGYFSSSWLRRVATGLSTFAAHGGRMRLLTSPILSARDWTALKDGVRARIDRELAKALRIEVDKLEAHSLEDPVQVLAWMIADELLEVRLAVPMGKLDGDYHPKIGLFSDSSGSTVVFHGSQNETERGFRNFETLDIFCSWQGERDGERIVRHRSRFERIWEGRDPHVASFSLPDAIRNRLARISLSRPRPYPATGGGPEKNRWIHQDHAVERFLEKRAGVLEMATGTGKTRTAQTIIARLSRDVGLDTVLVTTRSLDLLEQWYTGFLDERSWALFRHFGTHREASRFEAAAGPKILFVAQSYLHEVLGGFPPPVAAKAMFVADEIHGFGSPSMVRDLTGKVSPFGHRLGLSATPERIYDAEGQAFIESEVGPTIFEFTLEDAIRKGILCEFEYTPLPYELSDEDKEAIRQAIRRHHARRAAGEATSDEALYRDIAAVRKTSFSKIPPFVQHLAENPELYDRALLFVETRDYGRLVQRELMDRGIVFGTYYEGADSERLEDFVQGRVQCLVSCHRLSEGIDIPAVRNIVLFASARARLETIQRLGRCLRVDPNDPAKRAHVLDFVDLGDVDTSAGGADRDRHDWFTRLSEVKQGEGTQ